MALCLQTPSISNFAPSHGPASGGTRITIQGQHLNIGSSQTAFVNDKPCEIVKSVPLVSTSFYGKEIVFCYQLCSYAGFAAIARSLH